MPRKHFHSRTVQCCLNEAATLQHSQKWQICFFLSDLCQCSFEEKSFTTKVRWCTLNSFNTAEPIWHTEVIAVLSIFRDSLNGNIPATRYHRAECRDYMLVVTCTMTTPSLHCWHGCIGSTPIKRVGRLCILPI